MDAIQPQTDPIHWCLYLIGTCTRSIHALLPEFVRVRAHTRQSVNQTTTFLGQSLTLGILARSRNHCRIIGFRTDVATLVVALEMIRIFLLPGSNSRWVHVEVINLLSEEATFRHACLFFLVFHSCPDDTFLGGRD